MKCELCKKWYRKYPPITKDGEKMHRLSKNCFMGVVSCAFNGEFEKNWSCQTLGLIRHLCYEGQEKMPIGVDYQYCEDQKYATIKIDEVEVEGNFIGEALWVTWYKNRGGTDQAWILDSYNQPRRPTEKECIAIVEYYKNEREVK